MVVSAAQQAKRAFVKVILFLVASYCIQVAVSRESTDGEVLRGFRRLVKLVHPDKGGRTEDVQQLHAAKEAWEKAHGQSKALNLARV